MWRNRGQWGVDLVLLVLLVFMGWVATFGIEQFLDIGLYDESAALYRGAFYLSDAWRWIRPQRKRRGFDAFREESEINLIVVSKRLTNHPRFSDDREWDDFLEAPEKHGFTTVSIPGVPDRLVVLRRDLLQPRPP